MRVRFARLERETFTPAIQKTSGPKNPLRDTQGTVWNLLIAITTHLVNVEISRKILLPIPRKVMYRRPIRHHREVAGIERLELFRRIDGFPPQDREHGFQTFVFLSGHGQV